MSIEADTQLALDRHGPIMGSKPQQIIHALRLEVQRLKSDLAAEKLKYAVFTTSAITALRDACA